ncbi:MAG TPA: sugar phosphate nucleotidyltransferase [Polyangiaceae bacterium]|nr:sugar phosphate nucleotidyltransferase [Polyangiaceae bacterium]
MKVVLFCGGLGTRLREYSEGVPKPLVPIGYRPILWHVMRYYAHYGHKDFILCLGYKADKVKEYFLNYNEYIDDDFTMSRGQKQLHRRQTDVHDWNITFVDTGLKSNVGMRLMLARQYLEGEEMFLANYSDGLTDLALDKMVSDFAATDKVASFVCSQPSQSFHVVSLDEHSNVRDIKYVRDANIIVNAGYFVLRKSIFDYMNFGEELVLEPFQRLIAENKLLGFRHDGFWAMDTFKEQQELTDLYNSGNAPWEVWKKADVVEEMVKSQRTGVPT